MPRSQSCRWTAAVVTLCCVVASPVQAAPASPQEDAETRGHRAANESRWRDAAEALSEALKNVPNEPSNRGRRNQLASEAVTAYKLAYDGAPDCALLDAGLALADDYLQGLSAKYGAGAMLDEDYGVMSRLRGELEKPHAENKCPKLEPPKPPPGAGGASPPTEPNASGGTAPEVEGPTRPPVTQPADTAPPRRSRVVPYGVGLGVSAGLTIGMAIGAGVMFSQLRKPDGSRYAAIVDAAEAGGIDVDDKTDMCASASSDGGVAAACDRWNGGYRGFVAMAALSGVFAVSTAVFTGLLIRERRAQGATAQAFRRHNVQLGAAPRIGGATLTAGFRF